MIPRPRLRLAIWAAVTIVMAAYVVRSLLLRGGDFALDLPGDAVALLVVVAGVSLVGYVRHRERHAQGTHSESRGGDD